MPAGVKETGQRAEFRPDGFIIALESKGYRLAWTRMCTCPCSGLNDQTEQSDPNCKLCSGSGYIYFGPTGGNDFTKVGQLTEAQLELIKEQNAYVIRGLMTSFMKDESPWEKIGGVRMGTVNVTVRPENKLGYYDRLTNLDSTIVYQERVNAPARAKPMQTRYLIDGGVNLCQTVSTSYKAGGDFQIKKGRIVFLPGREPREGEIVSVHYQTHPTWLVVDFPHVIRGTNLSFKTNAPQTPEGNFQELALAAVCKLEFLVTPLGKPPLSGATEAIPT